jgi:hypothetical protein
MKTKKTTKKAAAKKATPKKVIAKKVVAAKKTVTKQAAPKNAIGKKVTATKNNSKRPNAKKSMPTKARVGRLAQSSFTLATQSRHIIPVMQALEMNEKFNLANAAKDLNSITFFDGREYDIDLFQAFLALTGIKKIRFRNAVNSDNEHTLTITGVAENGADMYLPYDGVSSSSAKSAAASGGGPGVGDFGDQCSGDIYP